MAKEKERAVGTRECGFELVGAAGSMFSSEPGLMHGEGEGDGRGEDWNCGSTVAGGGMGDNRAQAESERKG
jgi:hypothetical protein